VVGAAHPPRPAAELIPITRLLRTLPDTPRHAGHARRTTPKEPPMNRFDSLQDRASQLAGHIGHGIRHVPNHAQKWFKAGMAVGAARAGGRAVVRSTKRHPVITATSAAALMAVAAGLVVYAYRRRREANGHAIEGTARREPRAPRADRRREPVAAHGGDEGA